MEAEIPAANQLACADTVRETDVLHVGWDSLERKEEDGSARRRENGPG